MEDSKKSSNTQIGQFVASQLNAIKKALDNVLLVEGVNSMHYKHFYKDDITVISKNGASTQDIATALPVSWLSDGLRAVFSMVADIAYRCVKLNPHLGENACVETNGIVLIDEVDIFLHPSWQQRIIGDLQRTFPNIQFIVTTHSPQVVSSVPKECIRIISNGAIVPFDTQTQGVESQMILAEIFGTSSVPENDPWVVLLNKYANLEVHGQADTAEARDIYARLVEHFGSNYQPLLRIEVYRKFMAKKREQNNA